MAQLQIHRQELPLVATKRVGGSRTQVSRPVHLETGAPEGALRTATIKRRPKKSASLKVALMRQMTNRATKPDR
ncbi:hypothetical protein BOH74_01445 [Pseudomonas versuta]|uniref:Uncharacterized protein n=1 Tax=Pseudomonas versuta TaxID=1788301 RepID=A0A0M4RL80_9PSED|nr:hypothetical protein AOC04_23015 [Pseudomonas versuta]OKA25035.1 hypothetical protein BOH73_03865 [Pseudomonas versuta]OKA29108.1 hypothetical protein BOH74_01445 [Pseudomonas versuta]